MINTTQNALKYLRYIPESWDDLDTRISTLVIDNQLTEVGFLPINKILLSPNSQELNHSGKLYDKIKKTLDTFNVKCQMRNVYGYYGMQFEIFINDYMPLMQIGLLNPMESHIPIIQTINELHVNWVHSVYKRFKDKKIYHTIDLHRQYPICEDELYKRCGKNIYQVDMYNIVEYIFWKYNQFSKPRMPNYVHKPEDEPLWIDYAKFVEDGKSLLEYEGYGRGAIKNSAIRSLVQRLTTNLLTEVPFGTLRINKWMDLIESFDLKMYDHVYLLNPEMFIDRNTQEIQTFLYQDENIPVISDKLLGGCMVNVYRQPNDSINPYMEELVNNLYKTIIPTNLPIKENNMPISSLEDIYMLVSDIPIHFESVR